MVDSFSSILPVLLGAGSDPAYHEKSTTEVTTPQARTSRRLGSSTVWCWSPFVSTLARAPMPHGITAPCSSAYACWSRSTRVDFESPTPFVSSRLVRAASDVFGVLLVHLSVFRMYVGCWL